MGLPHAEVGLECWCGPEVMVPCWCEEGEQGYCLECHGRGLVPAEVRPSWAGSLVVVHRAEVESA